MIHALAKKLSVAAAASAMLFAAGAAQAQTATMTGTEAITRYHEAVVAAMMCDGRTFSLDQETKIAEALAAQTANVSTGLELKTLNDARDFFRARVSSMGCNDAVVRDRLALFRSNIAPSIGS